MQKGSLSINEFSGSPSEHISESFGRTTRRGMVWRGQWAESRHKQEGEGRVRKPVF
jgi:hypothetical protein